MLVQSFRRLAALWRQRRAPTLSTANSPVNLPRQSGKVPPVLRYHILIRDKYRCTACGADPTLDPTVRLEVDHKIPLALGGATTPENLRALCAICNQGKGARRE